MPAIPEPAPGGRGRWAWTIGALAVVVHFALAFQDRHGWSHAAAYADTARQAGTLRGRFLASEAVPMASSPGRIQGAAQVLTVLASALGPLLLAPCVAWTGSQAAAFYTLAAMVVLASAAAVVPMPVHPAV